ncbi:MULTISPECIES: UDP-glucose 4-epimerase GalE [Microbacterium]|uniref:UDP-glucose 4-epimerase GalE n=1 Tax=Microbacterium TaxID=33882 RepID=UPI00300FBBE2
MRVLLVGGAGYIGIHTAIALSEAGHEALIFDNLANSSLEAVARLRQIVGKEIPTRIGDACHAESLKSFVRENSPIDAVIHFAGLKSVAESVIDPLEYYRVNIGSALAVLETMESEGIATIVFSSSATVYGYSEALPLRETTPTGLDLANPYGKTKRMIEEIITDAAAADPRLRAVNLRYFNPVGAHSSGLVGEDPAGTPNNLMPYIARVAVGALDRVGIFGNDYDTPDGTGLRDYIHVMDLAEGHVAALVHAAPGCDTYNLGTGRPVSVLELIDAFGRACGRRIRTEIMPRRAGDVAVSYCDPAKANKELDWRATRTIDEACRDSWRWQSRNPNGYSAVDALSGSPS